MAFYALVVVIEANDREAAYDELSARASVSDETRFVGEPWEVTRAAANFEGDFDTDDVLNQRRP